MIAFKVIKVSQSDENLESDENFLKAIKTLQNDESLESDQSLTK